MNMKFINRIVVVRFLLLATLFSNVACSDDNTQIMDSQGELSFKIKARHTWTVESLNEIHSAKFEVAVDGELITLPSVVFRAVDSVMVSEKLMVLPGRYDLVAYTAFSADGAFLFEAELSEEISFDVSRSETTQVEFPVDVHVTLSNEPIKNVLLGICYETFGPDKSLWPWSDSNPIDEWEGLTFYDGSVVIESITFDERFAPMKRLSESITSIASLQTLTFSDTQIEHLPENIHQLTSLLELNIYNAKIKEFPESFFKLKLEQLVIQNSPITSFPDAISGLKNLKGITLMDLPIETLPSGFYDLDLTGIALINTPFKGFSERLGDMAKLLDLTVYGSPMTGLPNSLGKLERLRTINLANGKITALPDVFDALRNLSSVDLSGNPIADLPGSFKSSSVTGLNLNNCLFTEYPAVLVGNPRLSQITMANNQVVSIEAGTFAGCHALTSIDLSNNGLTHLPEGLQYELPTNFLWLKIDDNPSLVWTIPSEWCERIAQKRLHLFHQNTMVSGCQQ